MILKLVAVGLVLTEVNGFLRFRDPLNDFSSQEGPSNRSDIIWQNLSAQWHAMEGNLQNGFDQSTFLKALEIHKLVEENLINREDVPDKIKSEAIKLEIRPKIIHLAVGHMKTALLDDNYTGNGEILELADAISKVSETLFESVIRIVIAKSIKVIPMDELIYELSNHNMISQNLDALLILDYFLQKYASSSADRLKLNQRVTGDSGLSRDRKNRIIENLFELKGIERNQKKVFYKIHRLTRLDDFKNISELVKIKLRNTIKDLPIFKKNLYFASEVCFRNVLLENLYIWTTDDVSDNGFRLTLKRGKPAANETKVKWIPEAIDQHNNFRFESKHHTNQFMYGLRFNIKIFNLFEIGHFYGGSTGNLSETGASDWKVEFNDNGGYLLNKLTKLYLSVTPRDEENYVVRMKEKSPSCLWAVDDCSDSF